MKKTALNAWIASLPIALLAPMVIGTGILIFNMRRDLHLDDFPHLLALWGLSGAIHFIAYAFTGLPIFLCGFKKPHLKIWTIPGAILIGTGAGALVFATLGIAKLSYIGAAYGFITAIAAYRQRPHHHENAHHFP